MRTYESTCKRTEMMQPSETPGRRAENVSGGGQKGLRIPIEVCNLSVRKLRDVGSRKTSSAAYPRRHILGGISVASLRQTAMQHLVQGSGCDGLQLASYAGLSLDAVGAYMRAFGAPAPWPLSSRL